MNEVNVHDAKTNFSALLAKVEQKGNTIIICRNGKPVADLVPHRRRKRSKTDPVLRKISINYDPTESASEEEWPKEYR